MIGFENRLIGQAKKHLHSKESIEPLKGKDLVEYVKGHKEEFKDNGDALCVGAGYGNYSEEGSPNCDFKPFVKELGKVMNLVDESPKENHVN